MNIFKTTSWVSSYFLTERLSVADLKRLSEDELHLYVAEHIAEEFEGTDPDFLASFIIEIANDFVLVSEHPYILE